MEIKGLELAFIIGCVAFLGFGIATRPKSHTKRLNCKTYAYNFEAVDSTKAANVANLNVVLMSRGSVLVSDTLAAR